LNNHLAAAPIVDRHQRPHHTQSTRYAHGAGSPGQLFSTSMWFAVYFHKDFIEKGRITKKFMIFLQTTSINFTKLDTEPDP
jgi:hypothetical protein